MLAGAVALAGVLDRAADNLAPHAADRRTLDDHAFDDGAVGCVCDDRAINDRALNDRACGRALGRVPTDRALDDKERS